MKEYLSIIGYIDEGNFGTIDLARKVGGVDDKTTYAVKTVQRDEQTNEDYLDICNNELEIFKVVKESEFFIQLKYVCKTESLYRFVMDYKANGTMYHHLTIVEYLTLDEVIVCVSEMVTALEYLHKRKIVYRDLKLENILIDDDRHILLTDFGLARQLKAGQKLNDRSGTVAYMAPEIFKANTTYGYEVDWWSLGIITHELLLGHSPFVAKLQDDISSQDLQKRILNDDVSLNAIKLRTKSSSTCDFIDKLLQKNPKKRLGAGGTNGYEHVKRHPYFSQVNWLAVKLKAYKCLNGVVAKKTTTMYKDAKNIPVEGSRTTFRNEYFYTAPELKDPEDDISPLDGLTIHKKVQMVERVRPIHVFVPGYKGHFEGFSPSPNGSVSATLIQMLKKSVTEDCNKSIASTFKTNNILDTKDNNDMATNEPIRKAKIIRRAYSCRTRPYTLRSSLRNQREIRQG